MKNLLSIRMRASKTVSSKQSAVCLRPMGSQKEIHISGAEGLYEKSDIHKVVKNYIERALYHPKGMPDHIMITIEDVKQKPKQISALSVATICSRTPVEGKNKATEALHWLGVSNIAVQRAFELINRGGMRGAALITAEKGKRLEPDRRRGIRVSRLGISKQALKVLSARLSRHRINTDTVKEALILASKVASCKHVIAELCVSDDPHYTTGYVSSKKFGYLRIPNIKHKRSGCGGRAFFVKEEIDIDDVIHYLERKPVIVEKVASCMGIMSLNEILDHTYL